MSVRFVPAGDLALLIEFDEPIGAELNRRILALDYLLAQERGAGIVETVPAFRTLLVYYDPRAIAHRALCTLIEKLLGRAATIDLPPARHVELPCCYDDPTLGFDLAAVADRLQLTAAEVVRLQSAAEYSVYFLGFAPGQPYLAGLPDRLTIPRLETPRTKTPAGSVGIGGTQCCIYSVESPGGFWVLGRTPVKLYDPGAPEPILLRAGDRVRFRPVGRDEYDRIAASVHARAYQPVIA